MLLKGTSNNRDISSITKKYVNCLLLSIFSFILYWKTFWISSAENCKLCKDHNSQNILLIHIIYEFTTIDSIKSTTARCEICWIHRYTMYHFYTPLFRCGNVQNSVRNIEASCNTTKNRTTCVVSLKSVLRSVLNASSRPLQCREGASY